MSSGSKQARDMRQKFSSCMLSDCLKEIVTQVHNMNVKIENMGQLGENKGMCRAWRTVHLFKGI